MTLFQAKSVIAAVRMTLFKLIERKMTLFEKKSVIPKNTENTGKTAFLGSRMTLMTLMTLF